MNTDGQLPVCCSDEPPDGPTQGFLDLCPTSSRLIFRQFQALSWTKSLLKPVSKFVPVEINNFIEIAPNSPYAEAAFGLPGDPADISIYESDGLFVKPLSKYLYTCSLQPFTATTQDKLITTVGRWCASQALIGPSSVCLSQLL